MMSRIVPTILVVEDDDAFRRILVSAFHDRGYEAQGVADGAAAIAVAEQDSPEMAVVDLRLPDLSGLDVVRQLKAIDASTAIVVLTGYGSIATALESVRLGATHYLTKPTDADPILASFQHGLASRPRDLPTERWQHFGGGTAIGDASPFIPAEAREVPKPALSVFRDVRRNVAAIVLRAGLRSRS